MLCAGLSRAVLAGYWAVRAVFGFLLFLPRKGGTELGRRPEPRSLSRRPVPEAPRPSPGLTPSLREKPKHLFMLRFLHLERLPRVRNELLLSVYNHGPLRRTVTLDEKGKLLQNKMLQALARSPPPL